MIKKLLYTCIIFLVLACLGGAATLYWFVAIEPGDKISEENIRSILGRESPVFYNDGIVPLGVFFADAHRKYINYEDIPKTFINALVAAEDNRFFSHFGFDVIGIFRATLKNIQARRIVQGGSTLTQQTAKNLFKRKNRSFQAKIEELIYALRLEYRYSKEQIFEFYANQFYVSGNGLGLGVASRYYFDKNPDELSLVEAAFIAGSVKRPNYYNPFIKKDKDAIQRAKDRAKARVAYVLKKMLELGMIDQADYQQAIATDIPFQKGAMGYALDYVMEMVTDAVSSDRVVEALAANGIDNIATSGIRIITTVDKQIQQNTLYALRKQLSLLDVNLSGYEHDEVQKSLSENDYQGDHALERGSFLFGEIRSIKRDGDQILIDVNFDQKRGSGLIDREGLQPLVAARTRWQKNRWSEAGKKDFDDFLKQLRIGDRVWVSVRQTDTGVPALLDLEKFPEVMGGAIVMQQGRVISVAGGVENRFFNRAVYGRRTMGSSYKPFVYNAALQLGWNAADLLENRRDVFVYQNQPYFPRPDHHIDSEQVSMSWAGVRSENLASVWLTAHLCDHLSRLQLEEVADYLDLAPRIVDGEPEPYRLFQARIRDRYGIVIDRKELRKAAYRKMLEHIGPDLIFEGLDAEYETLKNMHYGLGYKEFLAQVDDQIKVAGSEAESKELRLRRKILINNFLALSSLKQNLITYINEPDDIMSRPGFWGQKVAIEEPALFYNHSTGAYFFDLPSLAPPQSGVVDRTKLQQHLADLDAGERQSFINAIKLRNLLSVETFDFVNREVEHEYQQMKEFLPYSMDVLEYVDDYRTLVGLHYLMKMGKTMGIESTLEPVLSFPLGSNVVTLLETTRMYEGLVTGKVDLFTEQNGEINDTLAIIDRIESEDGFVLFRPERQTRIVSAPETSLAVGQILENTIKFGTGRYADSHVKIVGKDAENLNLNKTGLSVPLLGKTGTANDYTNASFLGYLPRLNDAGNAMVLESGYAVGVYVGYDDNLSMRRKANRVTGSVGALPVWTDIVNTIIKQNDVAAGLDPVDLSFNGLGIYRQDIGQKNLGVAEKDGGRLIVPIRQIDPHDRYQPSVLTFGTITQDNAFKPSRLFEPFWKKLPEEKISQAIPDAGDVSSSFLDQTKRQNDLSPAS